MNLGFDELFFAPTLRERLRRMRFCVRLLKAASLMASAF